VSRYPLSPEGRAAIEWASNQGGDVKPEPGQIWRSVRNGKTVRVLSVEEMGIHVETRPNWSRWLSHSPKGGIRGYRLVTPEQTP
jgi:hypothetical protein